MTPDPRFERQGDDLHTMLTVSVAQAALGHRGATSRRSTAAAPDDRGPGYPARPRRADPRARACPTCAAAGRGDLFVHVAGGDADRAHPRAGRAAAPVRRRSGARRSRPPAPGAATACSRACAPPLASAGSGGSRRRRRGARRCRAQVFVDDPAHPMLGDEDVHHLGPGAAPASRRGGRRRPTVAGRWARTAWRGDATLEPLSARGRSRGRRHGAVRGAGRARRSPWPSPRSRASVPSGWSRS